MADRIFPEYYKWTNPNPASGGHMLLVMMEEWAWARFWSHKLNDWGPIDMGDLAEQIDHHESTGGVCYELIPESEVDDIKVAITVWFANR